MSVIVTNQEGKIFMYTKGADSVLKDKVTINKELISSTDENLLQYAKKGLRTLMIVYKVLTKEELMEWEIIYNVIIYFIQKALQGENRDKIIETFNLIEKDYYLLGCTAIEDKLQDKVPEVIRDFISIGIKVWILTGDKPDTSISIAFSCNLINHQFTIFDFKDIFSKEEFIKKMDENLLKIRSNPKRKHGLLILNEELKIITSDDLLTQKVNI